MDDAMKCPKCGEEMEEGKMVTLLGRGGSMHWGTRDMRFPYKASKYVASGITKIDLAGFRCDKCKLLVLDYQIYGEGKLFLEKKIKSLMEKGKLRREEAIRRKKKEKLIEKEP